DACSTIWRLSNLVGTRPYIAEMEPFPQSSWGSQLSLRLRQSWDATRDRQCSGHVNLESIASAVDQSSTISPSSRLLHDIDARSASCRRSRLVVRKLLIRRLLRSSHRQADSTSDGSLRGTDCYTRPIFESFF